VVKRASALVRLSRDHHESLVAAQRLRRATRATSQEVRETFLAHWSRCESRHFRVEEEVLLPALAGWCDPYEELIARTLCDHVAIRARVAWLRADELAPPAALHELGSRIAAHVRMEERELFPLIEQTMPELELAELADAVEHAERS
jgi:hemerythrin-like domain-containing protein